MSGELDSTAVTPPKVLIIDDAETIRHSVVAALEPAGFAVLMASNGFQGIAAMKETRDLRLVIVDLNMPGLSGLGVLDWMRKDASPHLPPAVFMTTELSEPTLTQARKAGAVGWLVKPCRPEQLLAAVKRILAKRNNHGT